ncbi:GNAT family N-acetyltransferase [Agrobacterium rosae]|uniref:GNAT family N-acetyltransferase n=1 Tax=Agrobacterium rosae TaxID=1972867 RepID=A0AAW9FSX9_9HYPH|nr:GNAT family N-acetyltransferase [Agrobacterium rosae]MDX8305965.1 GNAT family N-acetyltransferase [Agrobacterium rosae]
MSEHLARQRAPDIITTNRVILRRPVLSDANRLYAILADPQLFRYSPVPFAGTLINVKHIIVDWDEGWDKDLNTYVVVLKEAVDEPIGFVNIGPDEELGGALMHNFSGQGISEEIMRVLISELGLTKAWTLIDAQITPLIHLLEKVDFHVERMLPRHRVHPLVSKDKRDCVLMRQKRPERA